MICQAWSKVYLVHSHPISTVLVVLLGGGLVEIILVRLVLSIINCGLLLNIITKNFPLSSWLNQTEKPLK